MDWGEEKNEFLKMVFLMSVGYVMEKWEHFFFPSVIIAVWVLANYIIHIPHCYTILYKKDRTPSFSIHITERPS